MSKSKDEWLARGGLMPQLDDIKLREIERLAALLTDESINPGQRDNIRKRILELSDSIDDEFPEYNDDEAD